MDTISKQLYSKINLIKNINKGLFSKEKISLENKMETAVESENYELAAKARDSFNKSVEPSTPKEVEESANYAIHPAIIQAVNELLKEEYIIKLIHINIFNKHLLYYKYV